MEKISWTDRVNNEAVLHRVKEERNILHTIRRREANWIGHILRRNCLLRHIIEGKIRRTRRRGRRRNKLLDEVKEARRNWKLKEEAQDRTLWRTRSGRDYGPVARQANTWTRTFSHQSYGNMKSVDCLDIQTMLNLKCKAEQSVLFKST
jgi:hypothetical protein